jgi:hypothetical protein
MERTKAIKMTLSRKLSLPANMRMHLPKPRAPWWPAKRVTFASSQVIRGR